MLRLVVSTKSQKFSRGGLNPDVVVHPRLDYFTNRGVDMSPPLLPRHGQSDYRNETRCYDQAPDHRVRRTVASQELRNRDYQRSHGYRANREKVRPPRKMLEVISRPLSMDLGSIFKHVEKLVVCRGYSSAYLRGRGVIWRSPLTRAHLISARRERSKPGSLKAGQTQ